MWAADVSHIIEAGTDIFLLFYLLPFGLLIISDASCLLVFVA
jgi:hypothetical protein